MKKIITCLICLGYVSITALMSGCVSRQTTTERGYGDDTVDEKIVWFWQKDFKE